MNGYTSTIVLFGSVVDFLANPFEARIPRDIDVAYDGCSAADADAFVKDFLYRKSLEFAKLEKVPSAEAVNFMIRAFQGKEKMELHRVRVYGGKMPLTHPYGGKGSAKLILGRGAKVEWFAIESLPGIIRTTHDRPELCAKLILEYLVRVGVTESGLHREFRFLPYDGRDHDAYTRDGITAVRNARAKCTDEEWASIVAGIGDFGPVLEAMSKSEGLNAEFRAQHANAACAGGDGVLCLHWTTRTFFYPYGNAGDARFSFEQIVSLL